MPIGKLIIATTAIIIQWHKIKYLTNDDDDIVIQTTANPANEIPLEIYGCVTNRLYVGMIRTLQTFYYFSFNDAYHIFYACFVCFRCLYMILIYPCYIVREECILYIYIWMGENESEM